MCAVELGIDLAALCLQEGLSYRLSPGPFYIYRPVAFTIYFAKWSLDVSFWYDGISLLVRFCFVLFVFLCHFFSGVKYISKLN